MGLRTYLFDEAVSLNAVAYLQGEGFILAGSQFAFEDDTITVAFAGWLAHSEDSQDREVLTSEPGVFVTVRTRSQENRSRLRIREINNLAPTARDLLTAGA